MSNTVYILNFLVRTDIESMNPGKAMAQVSHATSLFEKGVGQFYRNVWAEDGIAGTTIVRDGGSLENIVNVLGLVPEVSCSKGLYVDPEYPLRDGDVVHTFPLATCGYVFHRLDNESVHQLMKTMSWYK